MTEKTKDSISPDAIVDKLIEAAPILSWHVSPSTDFFIRSATEFAMRLPDYFTWQHMPPDVIGMLRGKYVYVDDTLQGRTIELRSDNEVLSVITLEDES